VLRGKEFKKRLNRYAMVLRSELGLLPEVVGGPQQNNPFTHASETWCSDTHHNSCQTVAQSEHTLSIVLVARHKLLKHLITHVVVLQLHPAPGSDTRWLVNEITPESLKQSYPAVSVEGWCAYLCLLLARNAQLVALPLPGVRGTLDTVQHGLAAGPFTSVQLLAASKQQ
jgi:hypothetical protein